MTDLTANPVHVGRVRELWRYPVKSFLGERCEELELEPRGVVGDRVWAVRDENGRLGSGKDGERFRDIPGMFGFSARYDGDLPLVRFPDGVEYRVDEAGLEAALSEALGLDARLAREDDLPHLDVGPVHLVTSASLDWLEQELGPGVGDQRRFRPNLVLEVDGVGPIEGGWIGGTLLLGDRVRGRVSSATTRCRMTGLAQAELAADDRALRFLSRSAEARLGVYLEPEVSGTLRVGDQVSFLSPLG
jgi:uncharacterized protein YcbX